MSRSILTSILNRSLKLLLDKTRCNSTSTRPICLSYATQTSAILTQSSSAAGAAASLGGADGACDELACEIRTTEGESIATYVEGREGKLMQSQERLKRTVVKIVNIVNCHYKRVLSPLHHDDTPFLLL